MTNVFGYNPRSEVTNAVMGANAYGYAYDPIGNRTGAAVSSGGGQPDVTAYAANLLNQYTAISNGQSAISIPAYDADGNMLTNGPWAYTWDAENRLASACSNGVLFVMNAYDHRSRRIRKEVSVRESPSFEFQVSSFRTYLWDGWNIIRETVAIGNTQSAVTNYYTWGLDLSGSLQGAGGVGGLLAVTTCTTDNNQPVTCNTYFPCYDANGNVTGYVDTNGTVRARYEYSPFGGITAQSGDMADAFTHRFSTKPFDAETGLVVYQLRPYSPVLGRWLSRDPIGEAGGANAYVFGANNAIVNSDPFGLWHENTHYRNTRDWAKAVGVRDEGAESIGQDDNAVDSGSTSFWPWPFGDPTYHFNRASSGVDSRMMHYSTHSQDARRLCTWSGSSGQDDAVGASKQMGLALHPLQDWVAHGDF